jgi:hypothetical protein
MTHLQTFVLGFASGFFVAVVAVKLKLKGGRP